MNLRSSSSVERKRQKLAFQVGEEESGAEVPLSFYCLIS